MPRLMIILTPYINLLNLFVLDIFDGYVCLFGQLSLISDRHIFLSNSWNDVDDYKGPENINYTIVKYGETPFTQNNMNIGIKHGLLCINICQVSLENPTVFEGLGFQHRPRDVNALKNHVRILLLHKNRKHLIYFALFLALFCFALSPMSHERNFHGLRSF